MAKIDSRTQIYGIFGDPVSHSLSPIMQNLAFQQAGLNAAYLPFHVAPDNLVSAVQGIRSLGLGGVNITLPHKQRVIPLLDWVDEDALRIGAVNTIVNQNGTLRGYNTDSHGFVRSLREDLNFAPDGKSVLLFGAGGACRAAVVALLRAGVNKLVIVNRNIENAERLKTDIGPAFPLQEIAVLEVNDRSLQEVLGAVDLIVNTTSVGLLGQEFTLCPLDKIKASASVYDMVYSTAETPFVCSARGRGLVAADGIGMLASQGEEAFSLWFNLQPEKDLMKNCLLRLRAQSHS